MNDLNFFNSHQLILLTDDESKVFKVISSENDFY